MGCGDACLSRDEGAGRGVHMTAAVVVCQFLQLVSRIERTVCTANSYQSGGVFCTHSLESAGRSCRDQRIAILRCTVGLMA